MATERKTNTPDRLRGQNNDGELSIHWDDSNMRSLYANVCNVAGTREEVVLLFGVNQAWRGGVKEVTVQLQDRIILSPFAAKRLSLLLNRVISEYETRYSVLAVDAPLQGAPEPTAPTR